MKILRITVNNIASLAGTHSIDFTREPLRSAGLFGISGATGAGKSSLLDALCLALFDATPRLKRIGKLEQTIDGENQRSAGTLLRRGTSSGFAEVVFVGVDLCTWTARWSVRRSRNQVHGRLQPAEMTLFRGNIMPWQNGPVTAGGKKTLVQKVIVDKIGLTFDQFTRAVLLAQNEFATFLKAGDRERAEILQALTGTEHFERISRSVFTRCTEEKQKLESLQANLAGTAPMTAAERKVAEAKCDAAGELVQQIEATQRTLESHAAWFQRQNIHLKEINQASEQLRHAETTRAAATLRQQELEQTEVAIREASILWKSQEDATVRHRAADEAVSQATQLLQTQTELLSQAASRLNSAREYAKTVAFEQTTIQPMVLSARNLDAQLEPLEQRVAQTQEAVDAGRTAHEAAVTQLSTAISLRDSLLKARQLLLHEQKTLAVFAPFVSDSAKWLHLLREAVIAETEAADARAKLEDLKHRCVEQEQMLETAQDSAETAEQLWKTASRQLQNAESTEQKSDVGGLVKQRHQINDECSVLATLIQELDRQSQQRDQAESLWDELMASEEIQKAESDTLQTLTECRAPDAERDVVLATNQLRLIEAAVDDHARRLRASLQDDQPCPVCGSHEHRYQHQAPDLEIAGLQAARTHIRNLQHVRDTLKEEQQRQLLSVESRSKQISQQTKQYSLLTAQVEETLFSNSESPIVTTILARPAKRRPDSAQEQLAAARKLRAQLELEEQVYRQAVENTRSRRRQEEDSRHQFESQQQLLSVRDRELAVIEVKSAAATSFFRKTIERRKNATVGLKGLWSDLPAAQDQFVNDPVTFCETFDKSTRDYRCVADELAVQAQAIESQDARIGPLEEAAQRAGRGLAACEAHSRTAIDARSKLLLQRQQLFNGRSADDVEVKLKAQMRAADESVDQYSVLYHQAEIERRAAHQRLESGTGSLTQSVSTLQTAEAQLCTWINRFRVRFSKQLTVDELKVLLDHDEEWIRQERQSLKQLDDNVTTAVGVLTVLREQLQEHAALRPMSDDESVVQAALEAVVKDLKEAKTSATIASALITSDDQRRRQTKDLAEQLLMQENVADPWLKLNDLIGSREGDRFRMIAQRRTLDLLLRYTNHQLGQLAGRYRLQRLPESLNLIVIDEQMGDERRSVHSLSGGESFLVSLSLALGLASLTSSRMKIESLFIDEGFGSLDPETLSTAMNALMHLEAQGRKVGVISHVAEMTDAIPVQIHVVKKRGGASKIVIPGSDGEFGRGTISAETRRVPGGRQTSDVDSIAELILEILNREHQVGRNKVSNRALRTEVGCGTPEFKAAQKLLDGQVKVDGRSLRLM